MHSHILFMSYGTRRMVAHHSDSQREGTRCHHSMSYSFQLAARNLLYAPSHSLCYAISLDPGWNEKWINESTMRDRSTDPSHHERALCHLPSSLQCDRINHEGELTLYGPNNHCSYTSTVIMCVINYKLISVAAMYLDNLALMSVLFTMMKPICLL